MKEALRARLRSSALGHVGHVHEGTDPHRLPRVPIDQADPLASFQAKLADDLEAERRYERLVGHGQGSQRPRRSPRRA